MMIMMNFDAMFTYLIYSSCSFFAYDNFSQQHGWKCRITFAWRYCKAIIINETFCGRVDVDIQEFYDTTLLDDSKSVQQKTTETLQIVAKWEQTLTIAGGVPQQTTLQTEVSYIIHPLHSKCERTAEMIVNA